MTARCPLRVRAFAKINLSLRVLGRRADGYHDLRTVFQSVALHDTLVVSTAPGPLTLACDNPHCPADDSNLVWRAAARVWRASGRRGRPRGVHLELRKRIPMQAGLGGGSSDAAAALRACGQLWSVGEARLRAIAAELGADVPFFFEGGTALGLERGDLLFPLRDLERMWVVLAFPTGGVSTREAFGWLDQDREIDGTAGAVRPSSNGRRHAGLEVGNDLEPAVVGRRPEVGRAVRALRRTGAAHAAMSGSGSAVFGLFPDARAAEHARTALGTRYGAVAVTSTIGRAAYARQSRPDV